MVRLAVSKHLVSLDHGQGSAVARPWHQCSRHPVPLSRWSRFASHGAQQDTRQPIGTVKRVRDELELMKRVRDELGLMKRVRDKLELMKRVRDGLDLMQPVRDELELMKRVRDSFN